ncbi:uncharacterized protein LOC129649507 isoform X3 [Bubalus kerabau]|uniref:uncharacterized protein LOC129649507 isoform X3 n=1 Tax=Bubalus carabanensis TaxID=3119969 RepID=UPI00244E96D3|nr:uncharacterized protein LOC129649507 isoform X3 [Bubalus carabanensis]
MSYFMASSELGGHGPHPPWKPMACSVKSLHSCYLTDPFCHPPRRQSTTFPLCRDKLETEGHESAVTVLQMGKLSLQEDSRGQRLNQEGTWELSAVLGLLLGPCWGLGPGIVWTASTGLRWWSSD